MLVCISHLNLYITVGACCGADFGERSCPVGHGTAKRESAAGAPPTPL